MFDVYLVPAARIDLRTLYPQLSDDERRVFWAQLSHLSDLLRHQPERVGESAAGTTRRLFLDAVGVEYEVDPDFPAVRIRRFWLTRPPA